ncbi:hypothetical protein D3C87_1656280 [compost metagenome]
MERHCLLHAFLDQFSELVGLAGLALDDVHGLRGLRQAKCLAVDLPAQVTASAANARLLLADFAADKP